MARSRLRARRRSCSHGPAPARIQRPEPRTSVGAGLPTRSIVYTEANDAGMAREIRAAGAFYEVRPHLPKVLKGYAQAKLPPQDRREVSVYDRRRSGRAGGRRAVDQPLNV